MSAPNARQSDLLRVIPTHYHNPTRLASCRRRVNFAPEPGRRSWPHSRLDIRIESMYSVPMIRKELVAASAEPLILSLLARGESYGYAIIQEVKARSGGKLQWTDGMLYPVLHRMEQRGLIKARWGASETGRKRKYYSLKKDGKTAMAKHQEQWSLVHSVLAGLKKEQYV